MYKIPIMLRGSNLFPTLTCPTFLLPGLYYEVPSCRGKRLRTYSRVTDYLVEGWQVNTLPHWIRASPSP